MIAQKVGPCFPSSVNNYFRDFSRFSEEWLARFEVAASCVVRRQMTDLRPLARVCRTRPGPPYSVGDRSMHQTNSPELLVSGPQVFLDRPYPKVA